MINKYLERGIIRNSQSEWCSRLVIVPKIDGTPRMCVDFRELDNVTVKDRYPIPRIDSTLDRLSEAKIFSDFDARSGYHQIALEPEDMGKTVFSWRGSFYEFTRMPFGLYNEPATFQRTMDTIFRKEKKNNDKRNMN